MTGFAGNGREETLDVFARPFAIGLVVAAVEVVHDAFEGLPRLECARAIVIDELHFVFAGAVKDNVLDLLRQFFPGDLLREFIFAAERFQRLRVIGRRRSRPWCERALAQRLRRIGHHESGIDLFFDAEAVAFGAGAVRRVEREQPRLDFGNREAGNRAGEFLGEQNPVRIVLGAALHAGSFFFCRKRHRLGKLRNRKALGELQCGLEQFRKPLFDLFAHHDTIDHDVDVVIELLVERRRLRDLVELAVDLDALEALLEIFGEFFFVFALAAARDRREQIKLGAFGQRQHAIDHLRNGLAFDRQSGRRRIGHADARPQETHVIVDFGDGADRRARVLRGCLLFDRNGRRQAVDLIDVRLLHHLQKLARIGRERLDITPLAFGIDRVEGERRLAGARQSREHHELIARQFQIDVLEIVLARTANGDETAVGSRGFTFVLVGHLQSNMGAQR